MRIFLTGGTGYIGAAVLDALVRGGHRVDALARNSEKTAELQARGATPVLGNLSEPATYADAVAVADGAVHTAYEYSPRALGCRQRRAPVRRMAAGQRSRLTLDLPVGAPTSTKRLR